MPYFDHLLRALSISIPFGIMFGLIAGYLRKRLGQSLGDGYANRWELLWRVIYAVGIFMFGVLAFYCFNVIKQTSFGYIYLGMSILNGICMIRSFSRDRYDQNGVPRRHHRDPKRVTPTVQVQG
ncbi:hypothetical protein N9094_01860 [bacterium]|jgi:hypothetical protein|nr:hypothetical protein [bacterium]MDC0504498.1 hypothetical protein [Verrucomicrobiales bacterium]MDF1789256.1 hypothetical protein [Verrucomicrobiales bacterium]